MCYTTVSSEIHRPTNGRNNSGQTHSLKEMLDIPNLPSVTVDPTRRTTRNIAKYLSLKVSICIPLASKLRLKREQRDADNVCLIDKFYYNTRVCYRH